MQLRETENELFNKECLINSASKVNEFTINIDIKGAPNPNIYQSYGYDHDTDPQYALGSIDKIPYWCFGSNSRRWLEKLECGYKESENYYSTSLYINSWSLDNEIYFTNDVGLVGRARLSSNSVYFDNGKGNDIFNIVSRYKSGNRAMKFKTDPPPDGYLDPKTLNPI